MAPSKRKNKAEANPEPVSVAGSAEPSSPEPSATTGASEEPVKVNTASLVELKHALDDAAKAFFNKGDQFKQSHVHEDIRIGFGWLSCIIAGAVSFYGYKMGWESTKGWTYFGVGSYMVISGFLWLYAKMVEKDTVYVGTRRAVSKRVITERLTFSSSVPPHTPQYNLSLDYVSSTSGGKTLVRSHSAAASPSFGDFFDINGRLDEARWESYLSGLLTKALGY